MAERRMFSKMIIDSDTFLDLPVTAQLLYFHLAMRADDDGFVNKPKTIMRTCGGSDDDLKTLIEQNFIIPFESGIVVIKHWKIHNYIRKDTYTETSYKEEKALLVLDENRAYKPCLHDETVTGTLQVCDETVTSTLQVRDGYVDTGKDRLGKVNINISSDQPAKITRHKYGAYKNVLLSDEEFEKLKTEFPKDFEDRIERLSEYMESTGKRYKSHLATIRAWERRNSDKTPSLESDTKADDPNPFMAAINEYYNGGQADAE